MADLSKMGGNSGAVELLAADQQDNVVENGSFWRRFCRVVIDLEGLWLLLILPPVLFPTPVRALFLLVLPLLWLARWVATGRFVPATPLNGAILAFLSMVLIGLYATFDIAFSLAKIAGVVYGISVFYAVAGAGGRSHRSFLICVAVFLALGTMLTVLGLLATRWSSIKVPLLEPLRLSVLPRIPPLLVGLPGAANGVNPNELAGLLLWLLPVALVAGFLPLLPGAVLRWWKRFVLLPLSWIIIVLFGGSLVLTQSRSGLLGFALAVPLVALIPLWGYRKIVLGLVIIASFVGFLALSQESNQQAATFYLTEAASRLIADSRDTVLHLEGRFTIWSQALATIYDFPWTGIGVGTFRQVSPQLYPFYGRITVEGPPHAHNYILQTGLDVGLPGLVAHLAMWLGTCVMLRQIWKQGTVTGSRLFVLAFAAALLAYFIYGLTDTIALGAKPGFLFWFLLGLIAAYHRTIVPVIWK